MKKIIYIVSLIAILLLLIIIIFPFVMGKALKNRIEEFQAHGHLPNGTKIEIVSYHLGWIQSTMELHVIRPLDTTSAALPKQLVFDANLIVHHGPMATLSQPLFDLNQSGWLWGLGAAEGTVRLDQSQWPASLQQKAAHFPILSEPVNVQLWMRWGGSVVIELEKDSGSFYVDNENQFTLSHGKLVTNLEISRKKDQLRGDIDWQDVVATQGKTHVTIHDASAQYNMSRGAYGLWYNTETMKVPAVVVNEGGFDAAQIQNIIIERSLQLDKNNNALAKVLLSIDKIMVVTQELGPFKFDIQMQDINPQNLANLQDALNTAEKTFTHLPNPPANLSDNAAEKFQEAQFEKIQAQLQPTLVETLMGSEIVLNTLELNTPSGLVKLTGRVNFPTQISGTINDPNAVQHLIQDSRLESNFTAPKDLLDMLSALANTSVQVDTEKAITTKQPEAVSVSLKRAGRDADDQDVVEDFVHRGVLIQSGSMYTSALLYHNNAVTINGKTLEQLFPPPPPPVLVKAKPTSVAVIAHTEPQKNNEINEQFKKRNPPATLEMTTATGK
jgi:hypothetical protein